MRESDDVSGDDGRGAADRKAVRARIDGRVQGVYYRVATRRVARSLGLTGWVRNLPDGSVEALFQGPARAVDEALAWCHDGPPGARVDRVSVRPSAWDERWSDFGVTG